MVCTVTYNLCLVFTCQFASKSYDYIVPTRTTIIPITKLKQKVIIKSRV